MSTRISQTRLSYIKNVAKTISDLFDQLGDYSGDNPKAIGSKVLQIAKKAKTGSKNYVFVDEAKNLRIQVLPYSKDGRTFAKTTRLSKFKIEIFLDSTLRTKLPLGDKIYSMMMHELFHVFVEWGICHNTIRRSSFVPLSKSECHIAYLTNNGELNAHALEAASLYCFRFPNQPYEEINMLEIVMHGLNSNFKDYLFAFELEDFQKLDCLNGIPLKRFKTKFLNKVSKYIDRLNRLG